MLWNVSMNFLQWVLHEQRCGKILLSYLIEQEIYTLESLCCLQGNRELWPPTNLTSNNKKHTQVQGLSQLSSCMHGQSSLGSILRWGWGLLPLFLQHAVGLWNLRVISPLSWLEAKVHLVRLEIRYFFNSMMSLTYFALKWRISSKTTHKNNRLHRVPTTRSLYPAICNTTPSKG